MFYRSFSCFSPPFSLYSQRGDEPITAYFHLTHRFNKTAFFEAIAAKILYQLHSDGGGGQCPQVLAWGGGASRILQGYLAPQHFQAHRSATKGHSPTLLSNQMLGDHPRPQQ